MIFQTKLLEKGVWKRKGDKMMKTMARRFMGPGSGVEVAGPERGRRVPCWSSSWKEVPGKRSGSPWSR